MFQKGVSGNPSGKPKGAKNKAYLSLKYWFEMVAENSRKFQPKEKVEIAFRALTLLVPKVQSLPAEPGDSLSNAQSALDMLKNLEEKPSIENVPVS